ncbi:MAG: NUDIX hydrolase [Pseudonocardiaceae bacterium]
MSVEAIITYIVNVEVAIWRDSEWLLVERGAREVHASGLVSLVGGKVEEDEPVDDVVEAAARREVLEELGISLKGPLHYVSSSSFSLPSGSAVVNLVFASCLDGDAVPQSINTDEVGRIFWMSAQDVEASTIIPVWTKRAVGIAESVRRRVILMSARV